MKRIIILTIMAGLASAQAEDKLLKGMYADRTARDVGDLVTIMIEEQSSVQKDASDDSNKSVGGGMGFDFPGMEANGTSMWDALSMPEWSADASKSFSASGSKASSDTFSASITVYITEVMPNGNLLICGERKVNIDGDIIQFTLTGIVRPDDVSNSNTVLSSRVADALISYKTTGEFSKANKKGFFSKVLDWVIPF
jgi:flagellar L-ring protein precursor FlgH